ncbi:MAG TPA: hypothetical protein VLQ93_07520, partial [Myxococcaceae bacterium]|nr:hypothetical protein [Myxococcaceae bacterium]
LGELCLRMLAKSPQARYPDATALSVALEAAWEAGDASWEVPLCEAWRPDNATTLGEPEKAGDLLDKQERLHRLARHEREQPRRGRPRAPESSLGSEPSALEVAGAVRASGWRRRAWAGLVLGLVLACLLAVVRLGAGREAEPTRKVGIRTLPSVSHARMQVETGQEVAPPWKPPEVDGGAAPPRDVTPAPVATPTPPEESRVKTPQKKTKNAVARNELKKMRARLPKALLERCALAVTAAQLVACISTGTPPPAPAPEYPLAVTQGFPPERPPRPPLRCEPGIAQTMREQIGYVTGGRRSALIDSMDSPRYSMVREGPRSLFVPGKKGGKLEDSYMLHGQLVLGRHRVYGYFTQIVTKRGESFPACMVLLDAVDHQPGVRMRTGSGAGSARILSVVEVGVVAGFDE